MSQPKKKVSPGRRDQRRYSAAHRLDPLTIVTCPECSNPLRPHRVCSCGYYKGKEVFKAKTKTQALATSDTSEPASA